MTLLLTRTCQHALLVAIEEGSGFPSHGDRDIFVHSKLDLKFPPPVEDLIPPKTLITTLPTTLVPNPQWRTTLAYFISTKLLRQLSRNHAQVSLQIETVSVEGESETIGCIQLDVVKARAIYMKHGKKPFNVIKDYVVDKGNWKPFGKEGRYKIKAGLFIVDMPPPADQRHKEVATPLRKPISSKNIDEELGIELGSANISQFLTSSSSQDNDDDDDDCDDDDDHDIDNDNIEVEDDDDHLITTTRNNNNISSNNINNSNSNSNNNNNKNHHHYSSSSFSSSYHPMTMNHRNYRSISTATSSSSTTTTTTTGSSITTLSHPSITKTNKNSTTFLQIGNGDTQYTFVLRIVEAKSLLSLLPDIRSTSTRSYIHYVFADWKIEHNIIYKDHTWQVIDPPMCLLLCGHLHDIQQWLADIGQVEVCLVMKDVTKEQEQTVGKAMIKLKGWRPIGIEQSSFPVHDRTNRLRIDQPYQFARVTVQLGLTEGWEKDK